MLTEYLKQREERDTEQEGENHRTNGQKKLEFHIETPAKAAASMKIGDLCPECGQAALVNEEGCRKCYACGYSEC